MPRERKLFTEGYREMRLKAVSGMMLTLLLTFTLSTSTSMCQSTLVEEWVPYVPFSQMVDLKLWVTKGNWYMDISITFPDSGFMISDWGTVKREGCEIWVISEILDWTGYSFHVITIISHTYELGRLEDGNYTFTFMAKDYLWVVRVKSINLTVVEVVEPTTWTVDDDGPAHFHTIQEAINAANSEDIIFVHSGTYYENIVVNKTVSLVGENTSTTVIDGESGDAVVIVAENNVNITEFTIQHGFYGIKINYFGSAIIRENYIASNNFIGIYLYFSHGNVFSENCVTGNGYGVELVHSGDNIFRANNIVDNAWQALTVEGNNLWDFIQDMDTSNKVNGKPVYYWVNEQNKTFSDDAGYVAAVNSTNITVGNLTVERSGQGVLLAGTTNSIIERTILTKNKYGIYLCCSRNITINRNTIIESGQGIGLFLSHENNIIGNTITKNGYGIDMGRSEGNIISGNVITEHTANDNSWGIDLWLSENNIISKNNITNNKRGIELFESENNLICHNNFLNNAKQVHSYDSLVNTWDDGYPFGGNYWSDYNGTDWYSGLYQNATGSDGIGDTSFDIDENNQDNYPLMGMFSDFNAASEYCVQTICNSSISDFQFNGTAICFNVTGENGTNGFCRICIPRALMNETHKVFVNGTEVSYSLLPCSNSTQSYLYFTYNHSTQEVTIVPEFLMWTSMLLLLIVLTVAIVMYKRKLLKTPLKP